MNVDRHSSAACAPGARARRQKCRQRSSRWTVSGDFARAQAPAWLRTVTKAPPSMYSKQPKFSKRSTQTRGVRGVPPANCCVFGKPSVLHPNTLHGKAHGPITQHLLRDSFSDVCPHVASTTADGSAAHARVKTSCAGPTSFTPGRLHVVSAQADHSLRR